MMLNKMRTSNKNLDFIECFDIGMVFDGLMDALLKMRALCKEMSQLGNSRMQSKDRHKNIY